MSLKSFLFLVGMIGVIGFRGYSQSRWCDRLPRPIYKELMRELPDEEWFEVYLVQDGVYAIYEPFQWQEVISYLIIGAKGALLFDTGNGIGNMRKVVSQLTDLPVTVLNSHTHYDHIGGNADFTEVWGMETTYTRKSTLGKTNREVWREVSEEALCRELPRGVSQENHSIQPFTVTRWVGDGHLIDLGGRELKVISMPGHTPDAIALYDAQNRLLWTGDSFYEGPIWLYAEETDLEDYQRSLDKLAFLVPHLNYLLPGHNTPLADPEKLLELKEAFHSIRTGQVEGKVSEGKVEYFFGGFSLLMKQNSALRPD